MYRTSLLISIAFAISTSLTASAQQPRFDTPQPEHKLLARLAGDWDFERQSVPGDGSNPKSLGKGTIAAEMVGDFFVVGRWSGEVYGMEYLASQSLGYDIEQKKYTGYWLDSFLSFRWELTASVDEATHDLTITTRGPAPTGGTTNFRERYQFDSADSMTILGEMQQGERWVPITKTTLTRSRVGANETPNASPSPEAGLPLNSPVARPAGA